MAIFEDYIYAAPRFKLQVDICGNIHISMNVGSLPYEDIIIRTPFGEVILYIYFPRKYDKILRFLPTMLMK